MPRAGEGSRNGAVALSGVHSVEILNGHDEDKYVTAGIRAKEGYDVREEVARTVIQHGWPLREVTLEQATLEEFFVQVTASQAVAKEEAMKIEDCN